MGDIKIPADSPLLTGDQRTLLLRALSWIAERALARCEGNLEARARTAAAALAWGNPALDPYVLRAVQGVGSEAEMVFLDGPESERALRIAIALHYWGSHKSEPERDRKLASLLDPQESPQ